VRSYRDREPEADQVDGDENIGIDQHPFAEDIFTEPVYKKWRYGKKYDRVKKDIRYVPA
jgi:hypothetical protein